MGALVERSGNGNAAASEGGAAAGGRAAGAPADAGTGTAAGAGEDATGDAGAGGGAATVPPVASDRQPTSATPRPVAKTHPETRSIEVFTARSDWTKFTTDSV